MKTNPIRKFPRFLAHSALLVLALGYCSTGAQAGPVLQPIGPTPPGHYDKVTCGYLEVYSRTQQYQWGEGGYYYPHTPYWIYTADGKRLRTIGNNSDSIDETPEKVALTPGTYVVKAWSDDNGLVTVPVHVQLARTTRVHLEDGPDNNEVPARGEVIVGQVKVTKNQPAATQEKVAKKQSGPTQEKVATKD